ncbi:unnamed protein product, partial [Closterium sp. NIES-64]
GVLPPPCCPLLPLLLRPTSLVLSQSVRRLPLVGDAALARARGARELEERAVEVEVEAVVGEWGWRWRWRWGGGVGGGSGGGGGGAVAVVAEVAEEAAVEEAVEAAAAVEAAEAVEARVGGVAVELVGVFAEEWLRWWLAPAAAAWSCDPVPLSSSVSSGTLHASGVVVLVRVPTSCATGDRADCCSGYGEAAALGAYDAAALGAGVSASSGTGESALSGTASASASLTFTLDSRASRSFFRDRTTLTPLSRPVAVSRADPSGGPVLSRFSTVLPCPAAPSGTMSGLYLPSFSMNLVSGADLQNAGVHQFTPARRRVTHCTEAGTGRHLATFTRQPGSSLYTLTTASSSVAESSRRAAPHSSQFPSTEARCRRFTWTCGAQPASVGQGHERYFLLVVDDYSRYTTVFPLRSKGDVPEINLHPRVSRPETSPALLWTGKVGDASAFRVWGSRAFVRDL